jgi:hypothetical protein
MYGELQMLPYTFKLYWGNTPIECFVYAAVKQGILCSIAPWQQRRRQQQQHKFHHLERRPYHSQDSGH